MSEPINWREMTPGERDALIAEKVLGRNVYKENTWGHWLLYRKDQPGLTEPIPHYTTGMDVTLAAIEQDLDANVAFIRVPLSYWRTEIRVHDGSTFEACADTPQEAYWLARLRQRGCEVKI